MEMHTPESLQRIHGLVSYRPHRRKPLLSRLTAWLGRIRQNMARASALRHQIAELDQMDARMLADIGLTRSDVEAIKAGFRRGDFR